MLILDIILYSCLRVLVALLHIFPYTWRVELISRVLRLLLLLFPRYKLIAQRNLQLAFPDQDAAWCLEIIRKHCWVLARFVVDFFRIPTLPADWAEKHIRFPERKRIQEIKTADPQRGLLFVAGHLGSFEYLTYCYAKTIAPLVVIARDLKHPKVNSWWNSIRQSCGNQVISNKGAVKHILRSLRTGTDVGLLFDQNQVRTRAVFVDWFGKPAATTKAVALAVLKTGAPVFLMALLPDGRENYLMEAQEFDFSTLCSDSSLSVDEKIFKITDELSAAYQNYIRQYPEGWFWMHKRWKTTPTSDIPEDFYN